MKILVMTVLSVLSISNSTSAVAAECESFLQKASRVIRNYSIIPVLPFGVHVSRVEMDEIELQIARLPRSSRKEYLTMEAVDKNGHKLLVSKFSPGENSNINEDLVMDTALAILLHAREQGVEPAALVVRHNHPMGHPPIFSEADKAVSVGLKFLLEQMGFPNSALTMRLVYYPGWNARTKAYTIPGSYQESLGSYRVPNRQRRIVLNWIAGFPQRQKDSTHFQKIYGEITNP